MTLKYTQKKICPFISQDDVSGESLDRIFLTKPNFCLSESEGRLLLCVDTENSMANDNYVPGFI